MGETVKKSIEIYDAKISFMSLVDKPANLRPFLITKAAGEDGGAAFQNYGRILKVDDETHYVTGIAYEPMVEDAHGNFMTEEEIQKMAYWFAKNGDKVDIQHSFEPLGSASVVETWIAKNDCTIGDEEVKKGTWLVTVEIADADVWKAIKAHELNGFSIGGVGKYGENDVGLTKKEGNELEKSQGNEIVENNAGAPEDTDVQENAKGLLVKFGKLFGLDVVEKGAVAEEYRRRQKSSAFWNAINSFTSYMVDGYWDNRRDCWVENIEDDPQRINDAIADLRQALEEVLLDNNLVKCLTASAPFNVSDDDAISKSADALMIHVEKAGKKMSSANKQRLQEICQSLSEFAKEFDEAEGQEAEKENNEDMEKEELQKMIEEAIQKAVGQPEAPAPAEQPAVQKSATPAAEQPEELTSEAVEKMIEEAVQKAFGDEPEQPTASEPKLTVATVQNMIEKAINDAKSARGFATNINEETAVRKSGNDQHYLHGLL